MAFLQSGIFVRHDPQATPVPLVVDVSRSGRVYPKETEGFVKLKADLDKLLKTLAADASKRSRA